MKEKTSNKNTTIKRTTKRHVRRFSLKVQISPVFACFFLVYYHCFILSSASVMSYLDGAFSSNSESCDIMVKQKVFLLNGNQMEPFFWAFFLNIHKNKIIHSLFNQKFGC